nr:unnamed protein product [Digitaria exilis]
MEMCECEARPPDAATGGSVAGMGEEDVALEVLTLGSASVITNACTQLFKPACRNTCDAKADAFAALDQISLLKLSMKLQPA